MHRAVLTVSYGEDEVARELEMPTDVPASVLAVLLVRCLAPDEPTASETYCIEAHPPGRTLLPDETLDSAGVWDGGVLVIRPDGPQM